MNKFYVAYESLLPTRGTKYSAGYDFVMPYDLKLRPGERVIVDSGVKLKLSKTKYLAIHIRSSLGAKGVVLTNGTGIIDSDYFDTGDTIKGMLWNTSDKVVCIKAGERYMQGIIQSFCTVKNDVVRNKKRTGGLGSTGR